ncbi:MAG: tRNA pseudouridine(13) synthase TruD [Planctomycetota bacterium]
MRDAFHHPARVMPPGTQRAALGGTIRQVPEDFLVEEIPLLKPTGRGEHVIFQVEKRGMSTFDLLLRLSKGAKVSEQRIGYAGLKDTRAVTRQHFSVSRIPPERLLGIEHPRFRVLTAIRHPRGLKIGYHRGNRFTIRIRNVNRERIPAARRALEEIYAHGMPNAYGTQRFGVRQDGHELGRAIVNEDWTTFLAHLLGCPSPREHDSRVVAARRAYDEGRVEEALKRFPLKHRLEKKAASALSRTGSPREAFLALGRRPRRIWIAAWQSYLFNRVLARRVEDGTHDRLLPGDVACLDESLAFFPVDQDAGTEPARARPTGPLVGYDLPLARGRPGEIERDVLRIEGAEPEAFRADHVRARGNRRPLSVPVWQATLEDEDDGSVTVRFVLPPGSFATVLLEHLMASPASASSPGNATVGPAG